MDKSGFDERVNQQSVYSFLVITYNVYDLYINVSQTLVTKIFNDKDKSNNFVRAGNNIIVDYQSGLLMGSLPSEYNEESIMNIYYIDKFSAKNITMNNGVLVWMRNSVAE